MGKLALKALQAFQMVVVWPVMGLLAVLGAIPIFFAFGAALVFHLIEQRAREQWDRPRVTDADVRRIETDGHYEWEEAA